MKKRRLEVFKEKMKKKRRRRMIKNIIKGRKRINLKKE